MRVPVSVAQNLRQVAVRELFHVSYWLARTYGRAARPAPGLAFDASALPKATPVRGPTVEQLQQLEAGLRERDEKLSALLADKTTLDDELKRLRAEVAAAKQAAAAHIGIFERFVFAFGDGQDRDLVRFTQIEAGRAHQVADVFDQQQAVVVQAELLH